MTSANRRMPVDTTAAATPMTSAQPNSATSGRSNGGSPGIDSDAVPSPVSESRPMKTRAPIPAASSPGSRTSESIAPPSPAASISRNAPSSGEPSRVLMAAKLPAAAIIATACPVASRRAARTARAPRPAPIAISGASGPSTAPKQRVASAARVTPGSSRAVGAAAPAWKPSAGECPPRPGRYRIVRATRTPHTTSMGSGHQSGWWSNPSALGRSVKSQSWACCTSCRMKYATTDTGTPMTAATTSSTT